MKAEVWTYVSLTFYEIFEIESKTAARRRVERQFPMPNWTCRIVGKQSGLAND
jgi:hypothetical protein